MSISARYDAVVLAGGNARRFGGVDKTRLRLGGRSLLDRVLEGCGGASRTIVVGPRQRTVRSVSWVREQPPGGGPVPALAAGVAACDAELVLVVAGDLPFFTALAASVVVAAATGHDGAVLRDDHGRDQPLAAAYRLTALREALEASRGPDGGLASLPLRAVTDRLDLVRVPDRDGWSFDCDTWESLRDARARAEDDGRRG